MVSHWFDLERPSWRCFAPNRSNLVRGKKALPANHFGFFSLMRPWFHGECRGSTKLGEAKLDKWCDRLSWVERSYRSIIGEEEESPFLLQSNESVLTQKRRPPRDTIVGKLIPRNCRSTIDTKSPFALFQGSNGVAWSVSFGHFRTFNLRFKMFNASFSSAVLFAFALLPSTVYLVVAWLFCIWIPF